MDTVSEILAAFAPGAPNFDAMTIGELECWGTMFPGVLPEEMALTLFGGACARQIYAVRELSKYARYKAQAMKLRLEGMVNCARWHEDECDRIYSALPDFARW